MRKKALQKVTCKKHISDVQYFQHIFAVQHETANDLQVGAVAVVMAPGGDYQGYLLLETW
jgi:hypothetical protein